MNLQEIRNNPRLAPFATALELYASDSHYVYPAKALEALANASPETKGNYALCFRGMQEADRYNLALQTTPIMKGLLAKDCGWLTVPHRLALAMQSTDNGKGRFVCSRIPISKIDRFNIAKELPEAWKVRVLQQHPLDITLEHGYQLATTLSDQNKRKVIERSSLRTKEKLLLIKTVDDTSNDRFYTFINLLDQAKRKLLPHKDLYMEVLSSLSPSSLGAVACASTGMWGILLDYADKLQLFKLAGRGNPYQQDFIRSLAGHYPSIVWMDLVNILTPEAVRYLAGEQAIPFTYLERQALLGRYSALMNTTETPVPFEYHPGLREIDEDEIDEDEIVLEEDDYDDPYPYTDEDDEDAYPDEDDDESTWIDPAVLTSAPRTPINMLQEAMDHARIERAVDSYNRVVDEGTATPLPPVWSTTPSPLDDSYYYYDWMGVQPTRHMVLENA